MTRIVINLLLFFLPFVLFFAYARWANRQRLKTGRDPLSTPWFWLIVAGLVLVIAGFLTLHETSDRHTGRYVPAQVIDGKVVPGHFEGQDDAPPNVEPPRAPPPGSTQP